MASHNIVYFAGYPSIMKWVSSELTNSILRNTVTITTLHLQKKKTDTTDTIFEAFLVDKHIKATFKVLS